MVQVRLTNAPLQLVDHQVVRALIPPAQRSGVVQSRTQLWRAACTASARLGTTSNWHYPQRFARLTRFAVRPSFGRPDIATAAVTT